MALTYVTADEKDFSLGIDARSAENQISAGFVRELLNADIVEKRARKRTGYQGYAGNLPVRVSSFEYRDTSNEIILTLDSSIDLGSVEPSPLVIYGLSSSFASGGPFTTGGNTGRYYPTFTIPLRKVMAATSSAPPYESVIIPSAEHVIATSDMFVSVVESSSPSDRSYQTALPYEVLLDASTNDIEIQYQNSTGANKDVFVFYKDRTPVGGETYVATLNHTGSGQETFTITAATHNLSNVNIVAQIQEDRTTTVAQVQPLSFIIEPDGDIVITLTAGTPTTFYAVLSAAAVDQQVTGNVGGGATATVVIPVATTPWLFFGVYLELTPGGNRELVYPDSIAYDAATAEVSLQFKNGGVAASNFVVFYEYGTTRSNQLSVVDTAVTVNGTDARPQLTIWGLDHTEISSGDRAGWATHIDSYRSAGDQRVVAGLGGNLFTAETFENAGTDYLYGQLYPNLQARTGSAQVLGPAFWDTGEAPARTRGYITADNSGTNWATVSAVSYDAGTGYTKYTLSLPNKLILDSSGTPTTLGSVISTTTDLQDWLTVQGMSYGRHNGTFRVRQLTDGSDQIIVWVENDDNTEDYNDPNTQGEAGIFTDQLAFLSTSPFEADDELSSAAMDTMPVVLSSSGMVSVLSNCTERLDVAGGILTSGTRTSSVIPLREGLPSAAASVENIVRGDMLSYSGIDRLLRVLEVDVDLETITVDERLTWSDSQSDTEGFRVEKRWIPIEAPTDSGNQTPKTWVQHLDSLGYTEQDFLRSTMVQNNLYLTNGSDEVLKFDGTNLYRAGLFPWQPGLFATQDTGASARIVANLRSIAYTAKPTSPTNGLTITAADRLALPVGTSVRLSGSSTSYTVDGYSDDGTTAFFNRSIESGVSASGNISEIATYRYYFRLNAVDANDNIVASAVTGYQDHVVELTADAAINLKLVGFPVWGLYAYSRLELEIYRTTKDQPAPFYRVTTLPVDFDRSEGYITYIDTFADSDLIELDAVVSSGLGFGAELALGLQEPLRSKYVTSLGNSLVLGNLRDYPQLDIQLVASGAVTNSTFNGKIFTLRRDNLDAGTTTFMPDRARYEFVLTSGASAVTAASGSAGTSFTATVSNTAAAGDWVYLFWSTVAATGRPLTYSGWWQIASANATTITINFTGATAGVITTSVPDRALFATDPTDIPVPLGTDGNMGMANGDSFDLFDTMRRMSMAINSTMRMTDTSISGYEEFEPWMVARGGNDVGRAGRLIIRQPRAEDVTLEVELPSTFTGSSQTFTVFVNDTRYLPGNSVSASTRVYPSRIVVSYENYPEIFDSPTSVIDTESDSAIDVNSSDGQEITGIIPFFGEAAFGAAQQSTVLVVFKTNSIYLVDINEKRAGRNPVQRIETEGLGCTAPYSIASTKKGIIFANESGIYCLRRTQAIDYVGRFMERNWLEGLNLDQLAIVQGTHYGNGRAYKLSVPELADTINSKVFVYNHTGEEEGRLGAWGQYDNHPATGWANLGKNAYFGTSTGRVMSLRNVGDETDYRDDSEAITFRLRTRALDFGNSGIRKVLSEVLVNYRTLSGGVTTADVSFSQDLHQEFRTATPAVVRKPQQVTGIDDPIARDIVQVGHSTDRRRGTYFAVQIENSQIDQGLEVAGMDFRVGGLNDKGVLQASQTSTAKSGR